MFVLLTAILGFLSSCLPSIIRYFENKQKFKHDLQMATLQLEAASRNIDAAKEIARIRDTQDAREADEAADGFIGKLRASVRPVLTYGFVGLFFWVKGMAIYVIMENGLTIENVEVATNILLDEVTVSIITIVIGFYFGSREIFRKK